MKVCVPFRFKYRCVQIQELFPQRLGDLEIDRLLDDDDLFNTALYDCESPGIFRRKAPRPSTPGSASDLAGAAMFVPGASPFDAHDAGQPLDDAWVDRMVALVRG